MPYIFLSIVIIALSFKILLLQNQVERWRNKAQETLKELSVCHTSLDNQNAAIEQYKLNEGELRESYKKSIENIESKLKDRKKEVVEVIKKDPTCERQLLEIIKDQESFFNVSENM